MEEAESTWKSALKSGTIASLYEEIKEEFKPKVQELQDWIKEKNDFIKITSCNVCLDEEIKWEVYRHMKAFRL